MLAIIQLIHNPGGAAFNVEGHGADGHIYSMEDLSVQNAASSTSKPTGIIPVKTQEAKEAWEAWRSMGQAKTASLQASAPLSRDG